MLCKSYSMMFRFLYLLYSVTANIITPCKASEYEVYESYGNTTYDVLWPYYDSRPKEVNKDGLKHPVSAFQEKTSSTSDNLYVERPDGEEADGKKSS
jgi:hypothetical protein